MDVCKHSVNQFETDVQHWNDNDVTVEQHAKTQQKNIRVFDRFIFITRHTILFDKW